MHFRLLSLALLLLNCMDYGHGLKQRGKRSRRANTGLYPICKGCLLCSKDNGCLSCQQKLFFYLRRQGMRQFGECLHSCPSGYYGLRAPEMNRCAKGCEVGPWSSWGTCIKNDKTCGYKWGLETRRRQIVKKPVRDTIPCPTIAESRRCKMDKRHCPGEKKQRAKVKGAGRKKKRARAKELKQFVALQTTESTDL
ncbi:R-spondin-2 isoform X2 [Pristis pectinata]|uniref:R-spondin-2 isoform X2 n=1 Tax=Pristis pectinata TaxID=685728 RepID=UPI00223E2310|nr:R-spondin-2 isoform X2 [Pristis pectinata]